MTKFMINNGTDAWKTDVNLLNRFSFPGTTEMFAGYVWKKYFQLLYPVAAHCGKHV